MQVDIRTMPEIRLATIRHVGPYSRISEAFAKLDGIARKRSSSRTPRRR